MSKLVVVEGCTITSPIVTGDFSITSLPDEHSQVRGHKVYAGSMTVFITGGTAAGFSAVTGSGDILGTSTKMRTKKGPILLEGDSVTIQGQAVPQGSTTPVLFPFLVQVSDAGQTVVKGN